MRIDEKQLDRFRDMMINFGREHDVMVNFVHDSCTMNMCKVEFITDMRYLRGSVYEVDFTKVRSLTEAAAPIMADMLVKLGCNKPCSAEIKEVIFNPPATIVFWADCTKTVVQAREGEDFDPEKGLAMAISKKALGNQGNYYNQFKKWTEKYEGPKYAGGVPMDEFIRNIRRVFGLPEKD